MNELTDVTTPMHSTHRRRSVKLIAVGAVAAVAVIGVAGTAQAAAGPSGNTSYHIAGARGAGSPVLSAPSGTNATTVATLRNGRSFTVDCGIRGTNVRGNTVWHRITAPVTGYIADYYTDTPGFNQLFPGEATCGTTPGGTPPVSTPPTSTPPTTRPPTSTPPSSTPPTTRPPTSTPPTSTPPTSTPTTAPASGTRGQTINYNEGYAGSCVFYALDRFKQFTGVYPYALGDARYLATSAAAHGWTVSATPRINSLAVFQPGDNGASGPTGHVGWVEQVSGNRIYIGEMNAPNAFVVTHRWIDSPAAGVRYVYAA